MYDPHHAIGNRAHSRGLTVEREHRGGFVMSRASEDLVQAQSADVGEVSELL